MINIIPQTGRIVLNAKYAHPTSSKDGPRIIRSLTESLKLPVWPRTFHLNETSPLSSHFIRFNIIFSSKYNYNFYTHNEGQCENPFQSIDRQGRCKNFTHIINPLNAKLNPICHLLMLLGAHHILHVSRILSKQ